MKHLSWETSSFIINKLSLAPWFAELTWLNARNNLHRRGTRANNSHTLPLQFNVVVPVCTVKFGALE